MPTRPADSATLGLELGARGVEFAGALLHEPAAGSLAPGLLDEVAQAFRRQGVAGFGAALYGPNWSPELTRASRDTVAGELAVFRAFEPGPVGRSADRITLTVGQYPSPARHRSVRDLGAALGIEWRVLSDSGHAAHLEIRGQLAHWVRRRSGADLGSYCLPLSRERRPIKEWSYAIFPRAGAESGPAGQWARSHLCAQHESTPMFHDGGP